MDEALSKTSKLNVQRTLIGFNLLQEMRKNR